MSSLALISGIILVVALGCGATPQNVHTEFRREFQISSLINLLKSSNSLPDFCNELECPEFKSLNKTKDYEERLYVTSKWVTTHEEGISYAAASRSMFMKLFHYIDGENAKKEKVKMTNPVLTRVVAGPGPQCKSNFTQSFFVSATKGTPPKPTNKDVYFSSMPKQKVFVRVFDGFAAESDWLKNAAALGNALNRDSRPFDSSIFFTAEYDSPFKVLKRHNEVWYIAK